MSAQPRKAKKQADGAYVIERNIPPPPIRRNKYPFKSMKVGDSFFAPVPQSYIGAASRHYRKFGFKFTTKKEGDGVRIWRIE